MYLVYVSVLISTIVFILCIVYNLAMVITLRILLLLNLERSFSPFFLSLILNIVDSSLVGSLFAVRMQIKTLSFSRNQTKVSSFLANDG